MRAALALLLLASCGAAPPRAGPGAPGAIPVIAKMPAHLTYMVAVARLDAGLALARDVALLARLPAPPELAGTGLAGDRSAGIYATGLSPTLLLPVASRAAAETWVAGVHAPDGAWVDHAFVGDLLAVHVGIHKLESPGREWLTVLTSARSAATDEDVVWAAARAGARPDLLALVRVSRVLGAASFLEPVRAGCGDAHGWVAQTFNRTTLAVHRDGRRLELRALVELDEVVTEELAGRTQAQDPALEAARAGAAVWLGWGTDPAWLAAFGPVNLGKLCEWGRATRDLIRAPGFVHGPLPWLSGGALALFDARAGEALDVTAIAAARTRDVSAIPKAPTIAVPALADPLELEPGPATIRVSVGPGAHDFLAASAASADPHEIVALHADLTRLADPVAAARALWLALAQRDDPERARALAGWFAPLRTVGFRATGSAEGIGLSLDLELR